MISMSSTKSNDPFIKQVFILSITGLVGIIILAFAIWLFYGMRNDTERRVSEEIKGSLFYIQELTRLKRSELSILARTISTSPMLKASTRTSDVATIEDVLEEIQISNELAFLAIVQNKVVKYSSLKDFVRGERINNLTQHHFIGAIRLPAEQTLVIGKKIDLDILHAWEKLLNATLIVSDSDFIPVLNSTPTEIEKMPSGDGLKEITIGKRDFYSNHISLFNDQTNFHILYDKSFFWDAFAKRRNSLIFTGFLLFFLGLMASIFISSLIEPLIRKKMGLAREQDVDLERLLQDIDAIKNKSGITS